MTGMMPVSETTILSSTGAGTSPLEYFRTQFPYALTNGVIALCGFLLAGYTGLEWVAIVAVGTQFSLIWLLKRRLQGKMAFGR